MWFFLPIIPFPILSSNLTPIHPSKMFFKKGIFVFLQIIWKSRGLTGVVLREVLQLFNVFMQVFLVTPWLQKTYYQHTAFFLLPQRKKKKGLKTIKKKQNTLLKKTLWGNCVIRVWNEENYLDCMQQYMMKGGDRGSTLDSPEGSIISNRIISRHWRSSKSLTCLSSPTVLLILLNSAYPFQLTIDKSSFRKSSWCYKWILCLCITTGRPRVTSMAAP